MVGAAVGDGEPGPPPELDDGGQGVEPGSCSWPGDGGTTTLRVVDVVHPVNELWASIRLRFPEGQDLEGVATQAFVAQHPDGATALIVCQGHAIFEIFAPVGTEVDQGALAEVGRAAAQRVTGPAGAAA